MLNQVVQGLRFQVVSVVRVVGFHGGDGPAVVFLRHFVPPAVGNGEGETAVHHSLHTRGAGGFLRADGVVQPNIRAGDEVASQFDVVIGQEQEAVAQTRVVGKAHDLLHEFLAAHVVGVGFTCNNELHGALFVEQDAAQTLRVTQHQGQALVGGHATCETNGQGVRIEYALGPVQLRIGQATVCPGIMHGLAGHVHQVGA